MGNPFSMYFTSNQSFSIKELCLEDPYTTLEHLGKRLRKAMGEKEILSRYQYKGGEFRPPTYRSSVESLDRSCWTAYASNGRQITVVPYNDIYDGWESKKHRSGFMASAYSPHEYAYEYWDEVGSKHFPDLFDDATFGTWLGLLPQPVSVRVARTTHHNWLVVLNWDAHEPRVFRSSEMARYQIPANKCWTEYDADSWRVARAEAYVQAWEYMASFEPADRYESFIAEDQLAWDKKHRSR